MMEVMTQSFGECLGDNSSIFIMNQCQDRTVPNHEIVTSSIQMNLVHHRTHLISIW